MHNTNHTTQFARFMILTGCLITQSACDNAQPNLHWSPPPEMNSCTLPPNDGAGGQCIEGRADPTSNGGGGGGDAHDEVAEVRPP
jgi:hypothetical protein